MQRYGQIIVANKQINTPIIMNDKINRYRRLFKNSNGRRISVFYTRKKDARHKIIGEVLKVRKSSFIILIGGELKVNIGFRRIKESIFLDESNKIRYNLYYKK